MSSQMQEPVSLLRLPEVKRRVGLSRSTIYARIGRGEFPRPINLGAAVSAWERREIDRWIAERIAHASSQRVEPKPARARTRPPPTRSPTLKSPCATVESRGGEGGCVTVY